MARLMDLPGYRRFWTASTVSIFGTHVTTLPLQILAGPGPAALAMAVAAQFLYWAACGTGGPNEMGYRQAVTPDGLQGRMNATIRSINRAMIVVGAPLGGFLADAAGFHTALWVGIAGLAVTAVGLACPPFATPGTRTRSNQC